MFILQVVDESIVPHGFHVTCHSRERECPICCQVCGTSVTQQLVFFFFFFYGNNLEGKISVRYDYEHCNSGPVTKSVTGKHNLILSHHS